MIRKEDFFIRENEIFSVPDEDYVHMERYVPFLEAFSRITYVSIYVIDYFRKNFLYVSENPLFLRSVAAKEVMDMGFDFFLRYVPDTDLQLLMEINRAAHRFMAAIPPANRLEYTLSCDFHVKQPSGKTMLTHHEITPLQVSRDGKIWLALCSASLSTQTDAGNLEASRHGDLTRWSYQPDSKKWREYEGLKMKDYEKEILRLSVQGFTMSEIAEHTHKSVDTVKGYKRLLFDKLNVGNITQATGFAIHHRLI